MASIYRPTLVTSDIPPLVLKLYGMEVKVLKELDSYDDQNFLVEVLPGSSSPPKLTTFCPHGYVFKILNSLDSRNLDVIDMQTQVICHSQSCGYPTPGPVATLKNQHQEVVELVNSRSRDEQSEKYIARLFSFIPGKTLDSVPLTLDLCYEVGWYAGKMDVILKTFPATDNPIFASMTRKWNLTEVVKLYDKLHAITDGEQRDVVKTVIDQFNKNILSCQHKFSKGLIHGDFNDCNIVVSDDRTFLPASTTNALLSTSAHKLSNKEDVESCQSESPQHSSHEHESVSPSCKSVQDIEKGQYHISGVLDFGDMTLSLYIFEVAIAMMYVMINTHGVPAMQAASMVLAGYLKHMELSTVELQHLKLCICARFAQSLALGYFSLTQDPENEYILVHAKRIWPVLKSLWETSDAEVLEQLMTHVK